MSIKAEFVGDTPYFFLSYPVVAHNDGVAMSFIGQSGTKQSVGTINIGSFRERGGFALIANLETDETIELESGQEAFSVLFLGLLIKSA